MSEIASAVTDWIGKEIGRHRLWRQIWSMLYFTTAASTIIFGALTTASAGIFDGAANQVSYTAWLAATTTILASLEKVLRLREKWDLHRNIQIELELIQMRVASGLIDTKEVVTQIEKVAQLYSSQLKELGTPANSNGGGATA